MLKTLKYIKVYGLVLLVILTALGPTPVRKRMIVVSKTPLVMPMANKSIYTTTLYRKYGQMINDAAVMYNIPPSLIAAVIHAESGFDPFAMSNKGAMGMMQITPETWTSLGGRGGSPFNPHLNIQLGTKYLRELLTQFRGNLMLTIAAYNAGPGAVEKYRTIPPFSETRMYVPKVLRYYQQYRRMLELG